MKEKALALKFYAILWVLYTFIFILNYKTYHELSNNEERRKDTMNNRTFGKGIDSLVSLKFTPEWTQEYISWHIKKRKNGDKSNKYLIVVSYRDIDILQSLPYYLLAAYKTRRILLIKWRDSLEEYLVPPAYGLDWRVPKHINIGSKLDVWATSCSQFKCQYLWQNANEQMAKKRILIISGKDDLYEELKNEYFATKHTFKYIFDCFFVPKSTLWNEIRKTKKELGLNENYVAVHFDAKSKGPEEFKKQILFNSINCVVHKYGQNNKIPVYFTSDDIETVKYITKQSPYAKSVVKVVGSLDNKRKNKQMLIDLWLLRMSRCISYGLGTLGLLGVRLNEGDCRIEYHRSFLQPCPSVLGKI